MRKRRTRKRRSSLKTTRFLAVERLISIAADAIGGGYGQQLTTDELDAWRGVVVIDGRHNCEKPYGYELHARYSAQHGKTVYPLIVRGTGRCRKCNSCKQWRTRMWMGKAISEYKQWPRTLFGTLTFSPEEHYKCDAMIASELHAAGVNINDLSVDELFQRRCAMFVRVAKKFWKRLRHGRDRRLRRGEHGPVRGAVIRYLCVAEMHDSAETSEEMRGRPHFHFLMHEVHPSSALVVGNPLDVVHNGYDRCGEWELRWVKDRHGKWQRTACLSDDAFIRQNWTHGFTKVMWASNSKLAAYLCKYLTKSLQVRVIASERYGQPQEWLNKKQLTKSGNDLSKGSEERPFQSVTNP